MFRSGYWFTGRVYRSLDLPGLENLERGPTAARTAGVWSAGETSPTVANCGPQSFRAILLITSVLQFEPTQPRWQGIEGEAWVNRFLS